MSLWAYDSGFFILNRTSTFVFCFVNFVQNKMWFGLKIMIKKCKAFVFTCSSHCVYLQQEVRVEEEETPEHNTLREEDTLTTEEEQHQSPSNKILIFSAREYAGADLY